MSTDFSAQIELIQILNRSIESDEDKASDSRQRRTEVWRLLEDSGMKRNEIARVSNIDPIQITRALGLKRKSTIQ